MDFLRRMGPVLLFLMAMHIDLGMKYQLWRWLRGRSRRRWWVRPINRVRNAQGMYHNLVQELITDDHEEFFGLFRMWPEQFNLLVRLVHPFLKKHSIRTPLPTELRVAVTLIDGGVWANTDLATDLAENNLDLPDARPLPGMNLPFRYVFIGDEAFPLGQRMMRPYPRANLDDDKRIFNYRLSRARRCIENAFGILSARWLILHQPLVMSPENSENLFRALVCLHNFIMMGEEMRQPFERQYVPPGYVDVEEEDGSVRDGLWRQHVSPHFADLGRIGGNRSNATASGMRDYLKQYFNCDLGYEQCPWQAATAFRGHNLNDAA
ncbi:Protein ALP1-like [Frankliniella fusca]|uniref:Protein ALP1-like n=1 Tax=Frankliniella fusca TaxID=407009 RepID=A0AAE1I0B6_9NEOP|nr:Protein ALP1-like [Frankliniella fusca]